MFSIRMLLPLVLAALSAFPVALQAGEMQRGIAFFYADKPPLNELAMFPQVVVEPRYIDEQAMRRLKRAGSAVFAYVSVGELRRDRPWYADVGESWQLGENSAWNSVVMDLSNRQWQDFVLERLVSPLVRRGFSGVFLDTLDSYRLQVSAESGRRAQRQGLVELILRMHRRFPDLKILLNRGFGVIADTREAVAGVVAESLLRTWDAATGRYEKVADADHNWLKNRLMRIRRDYKLPVYVIDYVPPASRDLARSTAREIAALGFVPWVANPALDMLGVGMREVVPRRVLVLYDSQESQLPYSQAHRYLAAPLEYMGYIPEYRDIRHPLPAMTLAGRYAGIVSWLTDGVMPSPRRYMNWLIRQIDDGVPVAIIHSPGMQPSEAFLRRLGLQAVAGRIQRPLHIVYRDAMARMEARPRPLARGLFPLRVADERITVHESIEDQRHSRMDVILTAPWGGMALAPYVLDTGLDEHARWRLDIFAFLRRALRLIPMPVFDTTTENGARLLMTHIDGDGAASRAVMPGSPLAIRVIRDEILRTYPLPATVSVITSDMQDTGLYPERAPEMRRIARSIFALPHVEIASHTFSHPFSWSRAVYDEHAYLKIPGYRFSLRKEIVGSVEYINRHLAPPGKKVKVFLWSGDALPDEKALQMVDALGLRNMNGGNTVATRDHPSLTDISSMARPVGSRLQVYAPVMNENLYTHNWTRPRYGFERVIETFRLTDEPRRLKPIDIYYHFYSGSEMASLKALQHVYDWSMRQEVLPVWVSAYVDKVQAYYKGVVGRNMDGGWLLRAPSALRTVRIPKQLGWPDLSRSSGVIGVRNLDQGRYVHLAPGERHQLYLARARPKQPFLEYANAPVRYWKAEGQRIRFRLSGHLPVVFSVNRPCMLHLNGDRIAPDRHGLSYRFSIQNRDTGDALLVCR